MKKNITSLVVGIFLLFGISAFAQTNLISTWAANGNVGTNTEMNKWGWACTSGNAAWGIVNGGNDRYADNATGYASGRIAYIRWDGTITTSAYYTLQLGTLNAGVTYTFTWSYAWNSNASAPTLTTRICTSTNGTTGAFAATSVTGTSAAIATTTETFPCGAAQTMRTGTIVFTPSTTNFYYLSIASSTASLCAIRDLSLYANVLPSVNLISLSGKYPKQTFGLTGFSGLTADLTITAPVGITLSGTNVTGSGPYTIAVANAKTVNNITATWDGTTSVSGNVTVATTGITTLSLPVSTNYSLTDPGTANLSHLWTFDSNANDAALTNPVNGTLSITNTTVSGGSLNLNGTTTAGSSYMSLSGSSLALNTYSNISQEMWFSSPTQNGSTMISYFGSTPAATGNSYLMIAGASSRVAITTAGGSSEISTTGVATNDTKLHHLVAISRSDSLIFYLDGSRSSAIKSDATHQLSNISTAAALIGQSGYTADSYWRGNISKYAIYNKSLSPSEVRYLYTRGSEQTPYIITDTKTKTFLGNGTSSVKISGLNLANAITVTAPSGFAVSTSSLSASSTNANLDITFNGVSTTSGYVTLVSGNIRDSISVSGTLDPTIVLSKTTFSFSTGTNSGTVDLTGAYLTSDITITTPTGITLSGTNISGTAPNYSIALSNVNATNTITVNWNKAVNIASGSITIAATGISPSKTISISTTDDVESVALSGITLSSGGLNTPFDVGTTTYTAKVPADISNTTVSATATPVSLASVTNTGTAISVSASSVVLTGNSYNGANHTSGYTVNYGGNYTIADWSANGSTDATLSVPTVYGWSATPSVTWQAVNTSGNVRYMDMSNGANAGVAGITYTSGGSNYNGRIMFVRWDGSASRVYSYPVYLEACKSYSFTGKAAYNSVATAGTLTYKINAAKDNTGTNYATGTTVTTTAGTLIAASISSFTVPTTGVYYLTVTSSTASLCALADLAMTVNSTQSLAVSKTYAFFDNSTDGLTETFTVQGNALVSDVTLSVPTGITLSGSNVTGTAPTYTITAANAQCGVTVTATYDNLEAISAGTITVANNEFSKTITVDAVKNNVIGSWDANGSVDATASIPTASGWTSTGTVNWVAANLATVGSIRYIDAPASYTYSTLPYLGRILYMRWDGNNSLGTAGVFALPVTLEACKSYVFKGKGAWNSNASAGTITVAVNSASNNVGTSYGSGSIVCAAQYALINGTFTFSVPASGTYYLTFTSNVASLNAVADLSITENLNESMSVSTASLFFDGLHLTKTFTVTGNILANDISLSAPAGINLDKTTITKADAQCGVLVTATSDNVTPINSGSITITSGAFSSPISVIASADNSYSPLYNDHTNLIPDPLLNSLTGFTNSWGALSIVTGSEAYSGYGSAKLIGVNGASVTTAAITWTPSTKYRIRAMVKTTGNFQFGVQNSYAGTAANATYEIVIPSTNNTWKQVDYVFTTGAAATSGYVYFNMQGRGGTLGYIDNWELYNISDASSEADFAVKAGEQIIDQDITTTTFNVAPAARLTVNAARTLTAATLNLQSDNNGTATFLNNGTQTITTANVQQYLASGRNWYVSSPVTGATSNTFSAATNILYSYNETNATWPQISNNETSLDVMKGYVANMATTGAVTFTGTLNNGAKQIGLTRSTGIAKEGFNLVGNPYPSYLNFESALASASTANVSQTLWLRSKNAGNTAYVFDTYNSMTHIGTSNNNNSLIGITADIPPMQAFWVRVADGQTSATLALDNTMRSHLDQSIPTNRFKSPAQVDLTQQILRLQVSNGINSDEAIVLFNSGASNSYDVYDSPKLFNNTAAVPEIYTLAGSEDVVINGMNSIQYDTEMPIGFNTGQSNNFTIKAAQFSNFASGTQIVLRDKLLNTEQDLTVSDYSFTSDVTTTTSRFSLIFRSPSVATGINTGSNNNFWISTNANNQVIVNGNLNGQTTVAVYNELGQKLISKQLTSTSKVLGNQLVSGVYMVTVTNAGKCVTTKVIVK